MPGSGPVDRDENVAGIPIFTQLAGALAQQGYLVVRYDKRGVGQSGGRDERATIEDFAGDVLSVFEWLKKRKDVDKKAISVVGHSEGGAVAMIAGAREKDIAALVLIAAPGYTRGRPHSGAAAPSARRHEGERRRAQGEDRPAAENSAGGA